MPNAKGGKKFKRGKKPAHHEKRLIYKDPAEDQEYGKVIRAMGNGRFDIQCFDGKNRMGILAGNMRKKVWVNKDDIILFSKWEFTTEDNKCSIIHKYDLDESRKLQRDGEFPDFIKLEEDLGEDDNDFQFSTEDNEANYTEDGHDGSDGHDGHDDSDEVDLDDI